MRLRRKVECTELKSSFPYKHPFERPYYGCFLLRIYGMYVCISVPMTIGCCKHLTITF